MRLTLTAALVLMSSAFSTTALAAPGLPPRVMKRASTATASELHSSWAKNWKASNQDAPRWKPAKSDTMTLEVQGKVKRGEALPKNVRLEAGKVEIDIAHTDYHQLTPAWQGENRAAGLAAVKAVNALKRSGVPLAKMRAAVEQAMAETKSGVTAGQGVRTIGMNATIKMAHMVHDAWLARNGAWAEAHQKVSFTKLSPAEQYKDLEHLQLALKSLE